MRDILRQSWDIPHGTLWTSSQPQRAGCPRTVLGHPSWDPPDSKSPQFIGMSQDCPRTSLLGQCGDSPQLTGMSQDYPRI